MSKDKTTESIKEFLMTIGELLDFEEDQCHVCLEKDGNHTRRCCHEMYINSDKVNFKEIFGWVRKN